MLGTEATSASDNNTVILCIDETPLVAAALRWTLKLLLQNNSQYGKLLVLSCANPSIPPGRTSDNFGMFFQGLYLESLLTFLL